MNNESLLWISLRRSFILCTSWVNLEANREDIQNGTLALPLNRGVRLQILDVADYGAIAARVLTGPDKHIGETIEIASDE